MISGSLPERRPVVSALSTAASRNRRFIRLPTLALIVVAGVTPLSKNHAQSYPSRDGLFSKGPATNMDPDYAPVFHLGELHLKVPNRFLVFPWPRDKHPFDPSDCVERDADKDPVTAALCHPLTPHEPPHLAGVFLKFSIRDLYNGYKETGFVSHVFLAYLRPINLDDITPQEYAVEHDGSVTRDRIASLDTSEYQAFRDIWIEKYKASPDARNLQRREYHFISRSRRRPQEITCLAHAVDATALDDMDCSASIAFLQVPFPKSPSGAQPYSLNFSFPGSDIDNACTIGDLITEKVFALIASTDVKRSMQARSSCLPGPN